VSGRELERLSPQQAGALYLECSQQLLAFAIGLLRHRELAREVVQVTFGKALEQAGSIPPEARKAWLYRVARNEALAIRRRDGVAQRVYDRLAREAGSVGASSPHEELVRQEQVRRVQEALAQLPEAQRAVVRKRLYDERTFTEIAEELGVPLGTVLTRMRLALGKLEQALKDN
jgi:RNA polymerase sigma factor (sigma-70 family)